MKHTENNEIDLLLRSLAKREGSRSAWSTSSSEIQPLDAHLDADELNSFAEHTLPAATRARYMSHVVDCTRCRKIVTELTAAAGLPVFKIQSEQKVASFWQSLGAFLSPAVLRYAVPALAILAVITVGVLTLRQQNRSEFVARNQDAPLRSAPATQIDQPSNATTQSPVAGTGNLASKKPESPARTDRPAKAGEEVGVSAGQTTDSGSGLMAKDAPKPPIVTDGQRASQPTFAPEPAPAPAAAAIQSKTTPPAEVSKNEVVAKQPEQPQPGLAARETRDLREAEDKEAAMSRSRKAAAAGRGGVGIQTMEPSRGEAQAKRADEDSQTRTVEGRRFRRQGNTWVDTTYDGSRPTTTVVRGSEQYRALVADEPGIRLIAEKLSGEVVLVWKGRAYRIR